VLIWTGRGVLKPSGRGVLKSCAERTSTSPSLRSLRSSMRAAILAKACVVSKETGEESSGARCGGARAREACRKEHPSEGVAVPQNTGSVGREKHEMKRTKENTYVVRHCRDDARQDRALLGLVGVRWRVRFRGST